MFMPIAPAASRTCRPICPPATIASTTPASAWDASDVASPLWLPEGLYCCPPGASPWGFPLCHSRPLGPVLRPAQGHAWADHPRLYPIQYRNASTAGTTQPRPDRLPADMTPSV